MMFHAFGITLVLISTGLLEQQNSSPLEINLPGKDGQAFQMKMIFCPPGSTFVDPENPTRTLDLKGFHISEFKVTSRQMVAILGMKELDPLKKLSQDKNHRELIPYLDFQADYPALLVQPENIVNFCLALQEQYSNQNSSQKDTYEGTVFKVPSLEQWVYSARGTNDKKQVEGNPYFPLTLVERDLETQPDFKNRKADMEALWKKKNTGEFTFGTDQIYKILGNSDFDNQEMDNLKKFIVWYYSALTGIPLGESNPSISTLVPLLKSKPNAWGFRGALDPSCEWVMRDNSRASFWKPSKAEFEYEKSRWVFVGNVFRKGFDFKTAEILNEVKKNLMVFSTYNLSKDPKKDPEGYDDDFDVSDSLPSFRIVAENGLARDWLFFVNRDIFFAPNSGKAGDKIKEMRTYIQNLQGSQSQLKLFDSLVDIYQGNSVASKKPSFENALQHFQQISEPDKDFFELLSKVVGD